mgnify:CR=1 FL=1
MAWTAGVRSLPAFRKWLIAIAAAIGTMLMHRGRVQGQGVLPPEACLQPMEFLPLALDFFGRDAAGKGKASEGLIVERVDDSGTPVRVNF